MKKTTRVRFADNCEETDAPEKEEVATPVLDQETHHKSTGGLVVPIRRTARQDKRLEPSLLRVMEENDEESVGDCGVEDREVPTIRKVRTSNRSMSFCCH